MQNHAIWNCEYFIAVIIIKWPVSHKNFSTIFIQSTECKWISPIVFLSHILKYCSDFINYLSTCIHLVSSVPILPSRCFYHHLRRCRIFLQILNVKFLMFVLCYLIMISIKENMWFYSKILSSVIHFYINILAIIRKDPIFKAC